MDDDEITGIVQAFDNASTGHDVESVLIGAYEFINAMFDHYDDDTKQYIRDLHDAFGTLIAPKPANLLN